MVFLSNGKLLNYIYNKKVQVYYTHPNSSNSDFNDFYTEKGGEVLIVLKLQSYSSTVYYFRFLVMRILYVYVDVVTDS